MSTFTDRKGNAWRVEFDIAIIQDVKRELDIDLLSLGSLQTLTSIRDNSLVLLDVLQIVCAEQITERGFDGRGFAQCFDGTTVDHAGRAVLQGLMDFFPSEQRPLIARALESSDQMMAMLTERAMSKLDDPNYWERVLEAMNTPPGAASTSSPPSPASPTCASPA